LVSALATLPAGGADRRPITETDLFQFVWVADPQISPDGKQVVFVRVTVDAKKTGYDTALWVVGTDGKEPARPFTAGPHDGSPRWSPDGSAIAFVRAPDRGPERGPERGTDGDEGSTGPQIYLISTLGGEAVALTDQPRGAGAPVWSPDSRQLAYLSEANAKDLAKQKKKEEEKAAGAAGKDKPAAAKKKEEEHESDVVVVTRSMYRENGAGYFDFSRPAHIWVVDVPAAGAPRPTPRQITSGAFEEGPPLWSPDGKTLYFQSTREKEPEHHLSESILYSIPASIPASVPEAGGDMQHLAKVVDYSGDLGGCTLSPDAAKVACVGSRNGNPERSFNEDGLELFDLAAPALPRRLSEGTPGDVSGGVASDQHAPRGGRPTLPVWSGDGHGVIVLLGERGRVNLECFSTDGGKPVALTHGDQEVGGFTATPGGGRIALTLSGATTISDLYALDPASGALTVLYRPNETLFSQLTMAPLEEMTYDSFDGRKIQGFVQRPPDFDPAKKYPLIVNIHGGPHAAYGYAFFHEAQWMAAKGYVVLYTNPRGSSSFGQEFGNSNQYDFPGNDAKDILAGVDALVKKGYIDPKRMGVTGGSGGGILTNWIVTQTDRFAAAAAQRSISDWTAFWGTTDFTLFTKMWFHGAPWEQREDFARRSPLTYVTKVKTPLLFIEGEADYRTPPGAGGEAMYRALKYLKRPTAMVRFPGESHELSRSGQPWHRIERLRSIVGWFDRYLKGEKVEAFADVD
jgi:dipeptidyl aminopeptidase/acylaminoacyl peptidase